MNSWISFFSSVSFASFSYGMKYVDMSIVWRRVGSEIDQNRWQNNIFVAAAAASSDLLIGGGLCYLTVCLPVFLLLFFFCVPLFHQLTFLWPIYKLKTDEIWFLFHSYISEMKQLNLEWNQRRHWMQRICFFNCCYSVLRQIYLKRTQRWNVIPNCVTIHQHPMLCGASLCLLNVSKRSQSRAPEPMYNKNIVNMWTNCFVLSFEHAQPFPSYKCST